MAVTRRGAAALAAALFFFACASVQADAEGFKGGVRERLEKRSAELRALLAENKIEYEERSLQREYGEYGSSIVVRGGGADGRRAAYRACHPADDAR